ncbi:hypothetical protein FDECE_16757 [Fusarium decemcellulare]|nr:hypothetical protein FDECE_16757 [Fusarium decemcellulare]
MTALVGGTDSSVFSVVQLLWINLIMDTFAALALSTDYPTSDLFSRKPEPRTAPVLSTASWKMILGQSLYQLVVIFVFHYAGSRIFGYHTEQELKHLQTLTFNTYVLMQFFSQLNSRRSDNRLNFLEGILQNPWFIFVQLVTLGGQIIIVFVGGEAFQTVRLNGAEWGWSILFGFLTLPVGALIRLVPDQLVRKLAFAPKHGVPWKWFRQRHRDHDSEAAEHRPSIYQRFKTVAPPIFTFGSATNEEVEAELAENSGQIPVHASQNHRQPSPSTLEGFDLVSAVDSARYGTGDPHSTFEVHPDTLKEDPVIQDLSGQGKIPPSQNPHLLRHVGNMFSY